MTYFGDVFRSGRKQNEKKPKKIESLTLLGRIETPARMTGKKNGSSSSSSSGAGVAFLMATVLCHRVNGFLVRRFDLESTWNPTLTTRSNRHQSTPANETLPLRLSGGGGGTLFLVFLLFFSGTSCTGCYRRSLPRNIAKERRRRDDGSATGSTGPDISAFFWVFFSLAFTVVFLPPFVVLGPHRYTPRGP